MNTALICILNSLDNHYKYQHADEIIPKEYSHLNIKQN